MSAQIHESWIPSTDTFGARLALIRWKMGWNMKEAALACGFSQQSWREWELLGRMPRDMVNVAEQIRTRTGVDDYWIMTGRVNAPHPDGPGGQVSKLRPSDYKALGSDAQDRDGHAADIVAIRPPLVVCPRPVEPQRIAA